MLKRWINPESFTVENMIQCRKTQFSLDLSAEVVGLQRNNLLERFHMNAVLKSCISP